MEVIVAYKEMYPNTLLDRWQSSVAEYGKYTQKQVSSTGYDQIQITNSIITTSTYSNEIIRWYAGNSHFPRFCISNSFISRIPLKMKIALDLSLLKRKTIKSNLHRSAVSSPSINLNGRESFLYQE